MSGIGDRARVEIRPGVFVFLSGDELAAWRAKQDAEKPAPVTSATFAAPENAAVITTPPRSSTHKGAKPKG